MAIDLRELPPSGIASRSAHRLRILLLGLAELFVASVGYIIYSLSTGAVRQRQALAFQNANDVVEFERRTGLFHEQALQGLVLPHLWLLQALNAVYMWGHLPLIIVVATWLFCLHRQQYRLLRNALLISGGLALIFFYGFPVAPPRLVPALHLRDTAAMVSSVYDTVEPKVFFNPYAAMPSMHIGWDLLLGVALALWSSVRVLRWAGWFLPFAMLFAVVVTGNHFIVDGIAGAAVGLVGLGAALVIERLRFGFGISGASLEQESVHQAG